MSAAANDGTAAASGVSEAERGGSASYVTGDPVARSAGVARRGAVTRVAPPAARVSASGGTREAGRLHVAGREPALGGAPKGFAAAAAGDGGSSGPNELQWLQAEVVGCSISSRR